MFGRCTNSFYLFKIGLALSDCSPAPFPGAYPNTLFQIVHENLSIPDLACFPAPNDSGDRGFDKRIVDGYFKPDLPEEVSHFLVPPVDLRYSHLPAMAEGLAYGDEICSWKMLAIL